MTKEEFELAIDHIKVDVVSGRKEEEYMKLACEILNDINQKLDALSHPIDTIKKEQGVAKWGPKL